MSIEIIIGVLVLLVFGVWAALYIKNRTNENNNIHLFDFIPHLFPTLGILFTFIGIAIGLFNFDSSTSETIEKSIPELMNGLKTAFLVSIFGVSLLVVFSFWTNIKRKELEEGVQSEETLAINLLINVLTDFKNQFTMKAEDGSEIHLIQVVKKLHEESKSIKDVEVVIRELRNDLISTDINGNIIKPGNVLRDIFKESQKQSNSLQTFSSDLAMTISAGFEKILNDPSEGVVAELKLVKAEIESLGNKLKDPATDMTQNIVKELQESMGKMIDEFKTSMSGETKNEMERLAVMLGKAGSSLTDFPDKLQAMTDNLNLNFRKLQDDIQEISKHTLAQSEESTIQMKKQVEVVTRILSEQVGGLQSGQQILLTEQSNNLQVSDSLLKAFNASIEKMNGLTSEVNDSISMINQSHTELEKTIAVFRNISQDVNASTNKFGDSQNEFSKYSNLFLQNNSNTIMEIQKSLEKAKSVSTDYAQKFEIIESGLQEIFGKITTGLKDYQAAVGESLESYLNRYSNALTETAGSLERASAKQEFILDELTEQLSKLNGRRN